MQLQANKEMTVASATVSMSPPKYSMPWNSPMPEKVEENMAESTRRDVRLH